MRAFGQRREDFKILDLIARVRDDFHGRVDASNLQRYCRRLEATGYLRLISGSQGHDKVYRLIRDTGPICPVLRDKGATVFDANQRREYHPEDVS